MPDYDFRCGACGKPFALFYKTFAAYETGAHRCPHCGSETVTRRIRQVAIAQPSRDLSGLSSNEMLSVLDGGSSKEVGRMFQQVAESTGGEGMDDTFNDATRRLLKGESMEKVERDLSAAPPPAASSMPED